MAWDTFGVGPALAAHDRQEFDSRTTRLMFCIGRGMGRVMLVIQRMGVDLPLAQGAPPRSLARVVSSRRLLRYGFGEEGKPCSQLATISPPPERVY